MLSRPLIGLAKYSGIKKIEAFIVLKEVFISTRVFLSITKTFLSWNIYSLSETWPTSLESISEIKLARLIWVDISLFWINLYEVTRFDGNKKIKSSSSDKPLIPLIPFTEITALSGSWQLYKLMDSKESSWTWAIYKPVSYTHLTLPTNREV